MKNCRRCSTPKVLDDFYRHPQMADGHLNICKVCVREKTKQFGRTDAGREYGRNRYHSHKEEWKSRPRWHEKKPEQAKLANHAHRAVVMAVSAGRLTPATACEGCGATDRKLEAAHKDYVDYLDVRWLCGSCHRQWDYGQPKTVGLRLTESVFTVDGIEYRGVYEFDPRLEEKSKRWVIYGNRCRFRAVPTGQENVYSVISDRIAGNIKPLMKGPLMNVKLTVRNGKLEPF